MRQSYRAEKIGGVKGAGLGHRALAFGAAGGMTLSDLLAYASGGSGQSCPIKGNISIVTGERIFHVPGQRYYAQTKINPRFGERWFCSEFEAWAAGWRKSKT
ncbi:succinoglycan biosynthesis protein exoi [Rhizobium phaseoli]|nr:succinoglycan biosynthesis protein exoi [Rhizobium phaseoli]KKZ83997.1 hypothetical protein RPHASCH2410_PD03615 [Rhizobium phaseoli Ch24-10]RDJ04938.1 succinoglycan biosynthesis protein exoi [Rhizobium phaseoli]RDJ07180.1 succinoglycan biosynthesis protein exoi [Rhizobium phaseoli]